MFAWEQCKLSDISEKSYEKNTDNKYSTVFTNSAEHGIVKQRDFFDKDIANSSNISGYYVVRKNYFVYNPRISNQAKFGPINRNKLDESGIMSPLYLVFTVHDIDESFLETLFQTTTWHRFMYQNGDTGARADRFAIKDSTFMSMPIKVPSLEEQHKLALAFQKLDQTITLHEEKKHQLERLKSALLQKMFADKSGYPDIRFEGFSDEWEQCKLGDVAKINSGKDYKGLQPGKIPVYGTGGYMLSVNDKLSDIDAIGIGRKGTIDKPYYLNAPFWTVDTLFYVTPRGTVDISFMFPLFKNINWKRYDESTGVPSLSKNTIKKIRVSFPQNNEQVKIGDLFQKITQIITLHDQKLNLLKLVKQSLLQNMFI
ncbi:restriction endonuclease subunit S [Lactobacillus delbrueckii subsp. bulgaricus]